MFTSSSTVSRRSLLRWAVGAGGIGLMSACAPQAAAPAATPAAKAPAEAKPTEVRQVAVPTPAPAQAAPAQPAAPTAAPAAQPAAQVKRGGVIRAHRQGDWPTHDPHTAQTSSVDMILVYDYLTRIDRNPANGVWEVKPSLAESWELPDPTTVVFKLRPNVKFHDGTDFNAAAAKWNFDRMMTHPKSTAKNHTATIDNVEAVDPTTLRVKLKAPSPALFVNLTSDADNVGAMVSPTWAEQVGDAGMTKEAVGTGPFRMTEYLPSNQVTYKKFENYWKQGADGRPLPYPDEVQIKYNQDWNVALVQLRSGELDLMSQIAGKDVPAIQSNQNLQYLAAPWQATMYQIVFNAQPGARFAGEPMKKVRQAMNYAIDRDAIANALGAGIGEPNFHHLIPGQLGYSDNVMKYSFDPAKAKQLLSEAGFADGLDVTIDFISRPEDTQNAQLYQQMLAAVGVRATLQPSERVAWVQKMLAGNYEMGTFQSGVRPDPDLVLGYRFAKGGPGNYALWEYPELDRLLEEGRTTYDTAKRQEAYEKAQTIINDEAYVGFIWRRGGAFAMSKALKGFEGPLTGFLTNSTELWLDR